ncbi:MAG: hypothetical protein Unbinned5374contig1001_52 [Prokaryotic dsDNA virus sp.]|nr:MAG: hypothetical protein Unbinned5374contig1001_52 [Prokaryotic dsDNA virus sp.]|tara:strand:+ start:1154 stop:1330 length:177 start_codon:yes stop_codon:yes gene_type:complete
MDNYSLPFTFEIKELDNGYYKVTVICTGFKTSNEAENYITTWNNLVTLFPWENNPTLH